MRPRTRPGRGSRAFHGAVRVAVALVLLAFQALSSPHLVHHLGEDSGGAGDCPVLHVVQSAAALPGTSAPGVGLPAVGVLVFLAVAAPRVVGVNFAYRLRAPPRPLTATGP